MLGWAMPVHLIFILCASVLGTSFVSGLFGMVGGTILLGILLHFFVPTTALALHGVAQFTSNGWRAWLWRKYIYPPVLRGYFIGAMTSVALFTALQISFDLKWIYLFLGLLPFVSYVLPQGQAPDITKPRMSFVTGVTVVSLQLLAGVSGGSLDQTFVNSPLDRRQQIATKALIQVLAHLTKTIYFTTLLQQGADWHEFTITATLVLVASAILGNTLASRYVERMKQEHFKKYSTFLLMGVGIYFLYQAAVLFHQS